VIAYNLGNLWRRLVLPKRIDHWSRTSLQQRLVKTGGRLIKHARYYWLLLAESHLTRRLFGAMLRRMEARFSRTRKRPSWPLPGSPESLGMETTRGRLQRKPLGVQLRAARMRKRKSWLIM
jgi:hypothetical protein